MSTAKKTSGIVALGLLLLGGTARAETLTFASSIYGDGQEKDVALISPEGVACTEKSVVIGDTGSHQLLVFPFTSGRLGPSKTVKLPQLTAPVRVEIDAKGNVLALDGKTRRIVKVDAKGGFGGFLGISESKSAGATIDGFKLDAADNLYVLDGGTRKVLVFDPSGAQVRQIALPNGTGMFVDIAVDAAGIVYAVDAVDASVWSVGKNDSAFKALTPSLKDRMSFPAYMTANKGKLYLVDTNGNGIVLLGLDGSFLGRQLSIGWNDGLVNYPSQLCLTDTGDLFVTDRFNHRVQQFNVQ